MNGRTSHFAALVLLSLAPWGLLSEQPTANRDVPHIGYLGCRPLAESGTIEVLTALREGLRDLGRIEGRDYVLDVRSADNDADRFAPLIVAFAHPDDETFHGGVIYEYACHEGNRAMEGILAGARAEEAKAMKQNAHREN